MENKTNKVNSILPTESLVEKFKVHFQSLLESFGVYRWVLKEMTSPKTRRLFVVGLLCLTNSAILSGLEPWVIKYLIDGLIGHSVELVGVSFVGYVLISWFRQMLALVFYRRRFVVLNESERLLNLKLNTLFFEKSLGQHHANGQELSSGNLEKGRGQAIGVVMHISFELLPQAFDFLVAFLFLAIFNPIIGLLTSLLVVIYLTCSFILNHEILTKAEPINELYNKLNQYRSEHWEGVDRVKVNGFEEPETTIIDQKYHQVSGDDNRFWLWYVNWAAWRDLANDLIVVTIIAYGAFEAWKGNWSVSLLYPLYQWSKQIQSSIKNVGRIENQLQIALPSVRSMKQVLTAPAAITDISAPSLLSRHQNLLLEFRKVSYAYPDKSGKPLMSVLQQIDFKVEPGEKTALIGSSGSGKTTLLRLVMRSFDPCQGEVLVAGVNLKEIRLRDWLTQIGVILQEPCIFNGTIRDNLLYAYPSDQKIPNDKELWQLMSLLRIDFGERLTDGLDTLVGRRGVKLSGGQAQRLMIGAAVCRRPRFLIVDEATSSLDSTTERAVQDGLMKLLAPETGALIVTHRLSTVRDLCDKFVVLRNIEELKPDEPQVEAVAGSFNELFECSPTFRQLAFDQGILAPKETRAPVVMHSLETQV